MGACKTKKRSCLAGCLIIVGACLLAVLWTLVARFHWWLDGKISAARMPRNLNQDFSGEYLAEIKKTRLYTTSMANPFLPDHLAFSNAHVTIIQHGMTKMTVISQPTRGKAITNNITINGWQWRWGSNRLEYANTIIGSGLGLGIFPGIVKCKSRCSVEAVQADCDVRHTLRINLVNQDGGLMFFISPWSDPEDSSVVILSPISAP
jgi:hypothetical protein